MELNKAIDKLKEVKENLILMFKDDEELDKAIDKALNELDNSDKRIKMLIGLLNSEGCLNFDTYEEKIKYIDKLIELENKE